MTSANDTVFFYKNLPCMGLLSEINYKFVRKIHYKNMKLHLNIKYGTRWGQRVVVLLTQQRANGRNLTEQFNLDTADGYTWHGEIQFARRDFTSFSYEYAIMEGDRTVRREWNVSPRRFTCADELDFFCNDYWREVSEESFMYSSAYRHAMSLSVGAEPQFVYFSQTVVFRVQAPQLKKGEALALVGGQPPIGSWSQSMALRMTHAGLHEWVLSISATGLYLPFEYKYVVIDEQSGQLLRWETGDNRLSPSMAIEHGHVLVINDRLVNLPIERWKIAGLVIPVFSLRSHQSQGIGDFGDLRRLSDWACQAGMHMLQLLPIYDTTQTHDAPDSYPYNGISIYALHPLYLDLGQLPALSDADYMQTYEQERSRLNALPQLDYKAVDQLKHAYLHRFYAEHSNAIRQQADYQQFVDANSEWLMPYAAFSFLRDKYHTSRFRDWPSFAEYEVDAVQQLCQAESQAVGYYVCIQYLLHKQLQDTVAYAHERGVLLKGDIPIGISPCSVEAWTEPHYFHMNGQAGAPPDDFGAVGQNWGFPTYNWQRMAMDDYKWWRRRLTKMAEYFDAYRIDHVLGFFRIWQVPSHSIHALLGHFSPALPLSLSEIAEAGLALSVDRLTQPYITDEVLVAYFGTNKELALPFLQPSTDGTYALLPDFATQRQIERTFRGRIDEVSLALRDGLYRLTANVLFVPDSTDPNLLHPRIAAMKESTFTALTAKQQEAFRQLHEDYFYHRHDDFWYAQAMQKLPALVQATNMLTCAEDLGMVPSCVHPVLEQLRVLSLEIQTMPKAFGIPFAPLEKNPYLSVCTPFTHDMSTLRGWWEEDSVRAQHYYNQVLQHDGYAPDTMPGWLCEEVLVRHLYSPSMLTLISMQDWLSIDDALRLPSPSAERINDPANPNNYWCYRMHLPIEDLCANISFTQRIHQMIERAGR